MLVINPAVRRLPLLSVKSAITFPAEEILPFGQYQILLHGDKGVSNLAGIVTWKCICQESDTISFCHESSALTIKSLCLCLSVCVKLCVGACVTMWLLSWCVLCFGYSVVQPRAGSGVVRIDPLRFLAGCRTRRLNQA